MRTAKAKRRPSVKRDRLSVQLDVRELNLHRTEPQMCEYEAEWASLRCAPELDARPRLALAITFMSRAELERISRFPRWEIQAQCQPCSYAIVNTSEQQ